MAQAVAIGPFPAAPLNRAALQQLGGRLNLVSLPVVKGECDAVAVVLPRQLVVLFFGLGPQLVLLLRQPPEPPGRDGCTDGQDQQQQA